MSVHNFFLVGINYKKTDAATRGLFSINENDNVKLLTKAKQEGIEALFVLSTCNRTEIYAITENPKNILSLFLCQTKTDTKKLQKYCYTKYAHDAVHHLFEVGAGLDSQILGDYEIIGQLKKSFEIAKKCESTNSFLERLFTTVLQATKSIKQKTALSTGTISVSFAVIQYILKNINNPIKSKILLIGTGKIGHITCKNIIDYINPTEFSIMNRSNEKAYELAIDLNIRYASYEKLELEVNNADIIIVATNAKDHIINKLIIKTNKKRTFIDLSIPNNIEPAIKTLESQVLQNVDDLSKINDQTLNKRKSEIPKALNIIEEFKGEFYQWQELRKYAPVLKSLKQNLYALNSIGIEENKLSTENVDNLIKKVATDIRNNCQPTCFYMQTVHEFISTPI